MSWTFYLLAFLPSLLWGFSPVISKRGLSDGGDYLQASFVLVLVCGFVYWSTLVFIRGTVDLLANFTVDSVIIFMVGGVVGTTLGRLTAFTGVERVGASIANALISTRPLFSSVLAVTVLRESMSIYTGLGIAAIVVGLGILSRTKGGDVEGWRRWELVFPLAAAVAFALGNVIRRYGLQETGLSALEAVALNEAGAFLALAPYVFFIKREQVFNVSNRSWSLFVTHGLLTSAALISLFEALRRGPLVVVEPFSSLAPLFTVIFSYFLLDDLESITVDVIVGVLVVLVGVVFVSTG